MVTLCGDAVYFSLQLLRPVNNKTTAVSTAVTTVPLFAQPQGQGLTQMRENDVIPLVFTMQSPDSTSRRKWTFKKKMAEPDGVREIPYIGPFFRLYKGPIVDWRMKRKVCGHVATQAVFKSRL